MNKTITDYRMMLGTDLLETPAGILTPARSADALIKSEAKRINAEQHRQGPQVMSQVALYQNMQLYGAREKPRGTPQFADLYYAADKSFIDKILIQARADQSKMVWQKAVEGRQVGFKIVHDRHDDPKFKPTDDVLKRCAEMEAFLCDPTPAKYINSGDIKRDLYPNNVRLHDGLKDLVSRLVKAELVIDRKVLYRRKRADGKGYAYFHWLPGATVKPVHEAIRDWTRKHDPHNKMGRNQVLDRMSTASGFDLYDSAYVQIMDGMIVSAFTADEISVHIANPSDQENRQGYGESRLEISLDITATLLYAWNFNKEMFKTNYPESILSVSGDYDKAGLDAFKQQIMGESAGPGQNWRLPVISSTPGADMQAFKVESFKLRDTPKDMMFDQLFRMLINLKAAAYGAHPSVINFGQESGGGSGGSLFGSDNSTDIKFSKEHGFLPALMDMCAWFTDALIKPRYDDLRLIIVGLDDGNEKARLEVVLEKGKAYKTRNELRMMDGDEPKGFWVPDNEYKGLSDEDKKQYDANPWNYPMDAPIPSYMTTFNQKEQQDQMAEQQAIGGMDDGQGEDGQDGGDGQDQEDDNPWGEQNDQEDSSPWAEKADGSQIQKSADFLQDVAFYKARAERSGLKIGDEELYNICCSALNSLQKSDPSKAYRLKKHLESFKAFKKAKAPRSVDKFLSLALVPDED